MRNIGFFMKKNVIVVFSSHLGDDENHKFIQHIHDTIGVSHNIVCYPNYNQYSLTSIYNRAINEYATENSIMVFCHNDILFRTKNWGRILLSKFNSTDFQIIGLAGTTTLSENGVWWDDRSKMFGVVEHTDGDTTWVSEYSQPVKGEIKPVVLVDGVFIAVDCDAIEHKFDEEFDGFHLYDLSFCVPNFLDGCNIGVTTDIRILHKSIGITTPKWEENRMKFVDKYVNELPLTFPPEYDEIIVNIKNEPKVTVIIPTKNNLNYLINNIKSWNDVVNYNNYKIIIADTGSDDNVIAGYDKILNDKIKLIKYDYYNFAKINNDVVNNHIDNDTELILFCNDDIKLLNDALSRCVEIYNINHNNVGTIGIRLHYENSSVQHNGIMLFRDSDKHIRLSHRDIRKTDNYFKGINKNSIGNTGAFLLINKNRFIEIGGFSEDYVECLEDVQLNLSCKLLGLNNITVSDAVAYHYESISRNKIEGGDDRFMYDYYTLLKFILNNSIKI